MSKVAVVCVGTNVNFSVTATGGGLTYQWQEDQGLGFVNVFNGGAYSGATSASLDIIPTDVSMDNYKYICVVSGCGPDATSDTATLMFTPPSTKSAKPEPVFSCH